MTVPAGCCTGLTTNHVQRQTTPAIGTASCTTFGSQFRSLHLVIASIHDDYDPLRHIARPSNVLIVRRPDRPSHRPSTTPRASSLQLRCRTRIRGTKMASSMVRREAVPGIQWQGRSRCKRPCRTRRRRQSRHLLPVRLRTCASSSLAAPPMVLMKSDSCRSDSRPIHRIGHCRRWPNKSLQPR